MVPGAVFVTMLYRDSVDVIQSGPKSCKLLDNPYANRMQSASEALVNVIVSF